ncbi:hypothetical protein [Solibacillus sp. NPDC093137]|uniref:hypothetical protein n=1 Tax=Solibacillus sp. NPDC093137 TaxID=3390678 RepID=UPI003D00E8E3
MLKIDKTNLHYKQYNIHEVEFNCYFDNLNTLLNIEQYINVKNKKSSLKKIDLICIEDDQLFSNYLNTFIKTEKIATFKSANFIEYHYKNTQSVYDKQYLFRAKETVNDYILIRDKNTVLLIFKKNNLNTLIPLRIIREILLRSLENKMEIFFHASAIEFKGSGIIITGDSGAGKTSLMTHFVANSDAAFLANDRVIITKSNELIIKQFPLPIRLGLGTAKQYNELIKAEKFQRKQDSSMEKALKDLPIEEPYYENVGKLELTPKEFSNLFNSNFKDTAKLKLIIIPSIQFNSDKIKIIDLTEDKKKEYLNNGCFTPIDESRLTDWVENLEYDFVTLKENSNKIIEDMILNCKIIKLEFGTESSVTDLINNIEKELEIYAVKK